MRYFSGPRLALSSWRDFWRATGLQSILKGQRSWALISVRNDSICYRCGSKMPAGLINLPTWLKGKQANTKHSSVLDCLYLDYHLNMPSTCRLGSLSLQFNWSGKSLTGMPKACLMVDAVKLTTKIKHHAYFKWFFLSNKPGLHISPWNKKYPCRGRKNSECCNVWTIFIPRLLDFVFRGCRH